MDNDKAQEQPENRFFKIIGWGIFTFLTLGFTFPTLRAILEGRPNGIAIAVSATFIFVWAIITYFTLVKKPTQKSNFKKDGWRPMIWLLFEEIIVIIFLMLLGLNWNHGSDAGGNFGMVVSLGLCMVLIGITFDIIAYNQSTARPWQLTLIVLTVLCNFLAFMFMPIIMSN